MEWKLRLLQSMMVSEQLLSNLIIIIIIILKMPKQNGRTGQHPIRPYQVPYENKSSSINTIHWIVELIHSSSIEKKKINITIKKIINS